MKHELPPPGSLIEYPYLWAREASRGETEGRKERPVCLVLTRLDAKTGYTHFVLLAVTSKPPDADQRAIPIPEIERRRSGLSHHADSWIILDEFNYDVAERSYYFQPTRPPLGRFSSSFLAVVSNAFRPSLMSGSGRVDRTQP